MEFKSISKKEDAFEKNGCCLIKNIISEDCRKILLAFMSLEHTASTPGSVGVEGSNELYNSMSLCVLNQVMLNKVKELTKESALYSTYGFYRKYYKNQTLEKHIDRSECEVSLSICLSYSDNSEWPLYLEDTQRGITYKGDTQLGDAILYRGNLLPHWRDECPKNWCKQFFLHYSTNSLEEFDRNNCDQDKIILCNLIQSYLEQN